LRALRVGTGSAGRGESPSESKGRAPAPGIPAVWEPGRSLRAYGTVKLTEATGWSPAGANQARAV